MKARDAFAAVLAAASSQRESSTAGLAELRRSPGGNGTSAPSAHGSRRAARAARHGAGLALALAFGVGSAAAAGRPVATIENPSNVEYTSFDVAGTVSAEGYPTEWRIEYIDDATFQENLAHFEPAYRGAGQPFGGTTSGSEAVGGHIEGLRAGTTYHVRVFAKNIHGSDSAERTVTTNSVTPPVLSEVAASEVEYATATATGKVEISGSDPAFTATTCRFEAATQQQWEQSGNAFPEPPFTEPSEAPLAQECNVQPAGPGATNVEAKFTGLSGGTKYHLRLLAENQSGSPSVLEDPSTFETKPVAKPAVTGPTVSSIGSGSAHVAGTVAPNAPSPVTEAVKAGFNVRWFFTCEPGCGFNGPSSGEVEAGEPATEVAADLILQPNLEYTVTLHAVNAGGEETGEASFSTSAVAPDVAYPFLLSAVNRTATTARLTAAVNPHNSVLTECQFEYGLTTAYGQVAPCSNEPTGDASEAVTAEIGGLQPLSTYHFRIVAANSVGPAIGADQLLRTLAVGSEPSCENAAVREEQHAAVLPECRAWEMVSPLDKNGGNVTSEGTTVAASADGNAASFVSRAGFPGTKGAGIIGLTQYVSRRGPNGWSANSISPLPNPNAFQNGFVDGEIDQGGPFSEDLSKVVMWAFDLAKPTDDLPEEINAYQEDTATGSVQTVTQSAQLAEPITFPEVFQFTGTLSTGASADLGVISFEAESQLLPEAIPHMKNAYEWDHGVLRLAGFLPNGHVPSEGSSIPGNYRESVSRDGSRVAFIARKEGQPQLYLRRNHTDSVWVSEPEQPLGEAPANVRLQWMSPDGHYLLFSTTSQLLSEDTNEAKDLYLYTDGTEPASENNLTLITNSTEPFGSEGGIVLGASDDGSRIYFAANTPGNSPEIVYWHNGEVKPIMRLADFNAKGGYSAMDYPGRARVTADGETMALIKGESEDGQLYVYDAANETLSCASCAENGPSAAVPYEPEAIKQTLDKSTSEITPHWLSADGKKVFFSTESALVPQDINGVSDVYVYDTETGERRLISSGRGEKEALFDNASPSGSNVFFVTEAPLVGRDKDILFDLYDARVNGGFLEPPPPPTPCSGDGCRGALSKASEVSGPATNSFSGPGNPKPKHKRRHHRKHHKHHKHHNRQKGNRK